MLVNEPATTYPTNDGRPLAESEVHRRLMKDLVYGLRQHFRNRQDVYVGGALMTFYEEGNPRKFVTPDIMIVFDVERKKRDKYLLWKEGKAPDIVIELTSNSTKTEDLVLKKGLYARLGVHEYYIYDPQRDYVQQALLAFDLHGEEYRSRAEDPVLSPRLGLFLRVEEDGLKLYDPGTQAGLRTLQTSTPTQAEVRAALKAAQEARDRAEQRAAEAEARAARLEEQMHRLLGEIRRLP